jgi:hypothetical protein
MNNIINFPSNHRDMFVIIESSLERTLSNVKPEYKDRIKEKVLETLKEYDKMFPGIEFELPENTTEEQLSNISKTMAKQHKSIQKLIVESILLKVNKLLDEIEQNTYNN